MTAAEGAAQREHLKAERLPSDGATGGVLQPEKRTVKMVLSHRRLVVIAYIVQI